MVEILVLGPFCNWMSAQAESKGRRGGPFRRMALVSWCLGEVIGLFAGLAVAAPTEAAALLVIYLCALTGAGIGALMTYIVVRSLKTDPVHSALTAFPSIGK